MYLVIGYGNTLRSDDGVGWRVAEQVEDWQWPGVRSLACHQLTPELAADMAPVATVIFVDAVSADLMPQVQIEPLQPSQQQASLGHFSQPRSLLALTQALYSHTPTAYAIWIPAANFEFGEQLSSLAQAGALQALEIIQNLVK
ncbi:hydrogenase maturation protease [Almyronema epifaneia]|uniref:Hydrogenase maturation protease n=1 Tax=Almyronema epifaneia S1 TaxID=2991925 RepID=A0ABW6IIV2_9CYAN